ncbi:MAG TPA: hypothetical protein VFE21_01465 [Rubrobacteraceae bacterium]|nr:hypothetical protein [Rubrobacteraceae bacterium]
MVEVADRTTDAAWKIRNLEDYDRRLERAARRVDEVDRERGEAAFVIYESVLVKSGRPLEEIRELVRKFQAEFEDDEDQLTIPRVSGIMNVEGNEWFFGDDELRVITGRLLGQFQHRVAQYNYINEREVLRRWADSYDTRLFIRRRIYDTEPVVGVVAGFDLPLVQYLRVAAGGNSLVPTGEVGRALAALGFGETDDEYEILARAENLSLHLDLPAPIVGEMLEDIAREGLTDFPEPPREPEGTKQEPTAEETEKPPEPSGEDRAARRVAREDPKKGEEPSRVQDPQAKETPGVQEEAVADPPTSPEFGTEDAPGNSEQR